MRGPVSSTVSAMSSDGNQSDRNQSALADAMHELAEAFRHAGQLAAEQDRVRPHTGTTVRVKQVPSDSWAGQSWSGAGPQLVPVAVIARQSPRSGCRVTVVNRGTIGVWLTPHVTPMDAAGSAPTAGFYLPAAAVAGGDGGTITFDTRAGIHFVTGESGTYRLDVLSETYNAHMDWDQE